jgi:hypothetical protein
MKNIVLYSTIAASFTFLVIAGLTERPLFRSDRPEYRVIGTPRIVTEQTLSGLEVKAGKALFKYKSDDANDAQQKWVFKGEVPTTHTSFDTVSQFRITGGGEDESSTSASGAVILADNYYGIDHTFYKNSTGVKGKNGTKLKQKFTYFTATQKKDSSSDGTIEPLSSHHTYPSYGKFKAKIKDGKMSFLYKITKANEGNMLVGMDDYDTIRSEMEKEKKAEGTATMDVTFAVDDVGYSHTQEVDAKANKNKAKTKL